MGNDKNDVQVYTEEIGNCTYVAIFTAPPGGCFFAATTPATDGQASLRVSVLTPWPCESRLGDGDIFRCAECEQAWPGTSFDVPNFDALVARVTPLVTRRCHGTSLWSLTVAADAELPFGTVFPDILTHTGCDTVRRPHCTRQPRLHSTSHVEPAVSSMSTPSTAASMQDEANLNNGRAITVYGKECQHVSDDVLDDPLVREILDEDRESNSQIGQDPHRVPSLTVMPTPVESAESEDEERECWICKDSEGTLINPCLCKGSMQGVHLHCVEDWVQHCKAAKGERPQCPVCKTPYAGRETIPGLASYTAHMGKYIACLTLRGLLLVGVLISYWLSLKEWMVPDITVRTIVFVVDALFLSVKVLLVTCAMPPTWRVLPFYGNDISFATVHSEGTKCAMELGAALTILFLWLFFDEIEWIHVVPIAVVSLAPPICKFVVAESMVGCTLCVPRFARCFGRLITCPYLALRDAWWAFRSRPRYYLSPMNYGLHTILCLVVLIFCALPEDEIFLITVMAHSFMMVVILVLHVWSTSWKLVRGRLWWVQLQLCGLAAYCVNVLRAFVSEHTPSWFAHSILLFSLIWYMLNVVLVLTANWHSIRKQYHRWQHRNGSFTFQERQEM